MVIVRSHANLERLFLYFATVVLMVGILYWAQAVLIPLAIAVLLTFILVPLVSLLQRWGLPRLPAILIVAVLVFILLGSIINVFFMQVKSLAVELPTYKTQIEGISSAYGVTPVFVWLPFSGYKYDLQYHVALNPIFKFGRHELSVQGYPLMADRWKGSNFGKDFLWLADMQVDKKEPLYLDTLHYTADFSAEVAGEIAGFVMVSREASR